MTPGLPAPDSHDAVHVYSLQDALSTAFALQEKSLPFDQRQGKRNCRGGAGPAARGARGRAAVRRARGGVSLPRRSRAGHVAKVGYDFAAEFEYGLDLILDLILDALESAATHPDRRGGSARFARTSVCWIRHALLLSRPIDPDHLTSVKAMFPAVVLAVGVLFQNKRSSARRLLKSHEFPGGATLHVAGCS